MTRSLVRSTVFNISFIIVTAICCVLFLPSLFMPRRWYLVVNDIWHYIVWGLEIFILDLDYEVHGLENLPEDGSYLVAAKHMSPYETLKLRLLFDDPAIVLKQELLKIPIWGAYLKKSDVIAIDRSTPEQAISSIQMGAQRMKDQGRPIIIFPQGTRVYPDETPESKPYKVGIARMQEATGLPIIPMATNSGLFWPKKGWLKSPGKVVFEFLPAIEPGQERAALLKTLETSLEGKSNALMQEAKLLNNHQKRSPPTWLYCLIAALLVITYSGLWLFIAQEEEKAYQNAFIGTSDIRRISGDIKISGYPGPINLQINQEQLISPRGSVHIHNIEIHSWPIPTLPVSIKTGSLDIHSPAWQGHINFDFLSGRIQISNSHITILESLLQRKDFKLKISGTIVLDTQPHPEPDLLLEIENHMAFLQYLTDRKIIKDRYAMFVGAGFSALSENGVVRIPLARRGQTLYAGPLPILSF